MKRLIYLVVIILVVFWAQPAEAGCRSYCGYPPAGYAGNYYYGYQNYNYDSMMGNWYGVDNRQMMLDPFGDWYGVNNTGTFSDPLGMGQWYGVDNSGQTNNPFGDWYGVNNMNSTDSMGNWYGVNNNSQGTTYTTPRTNYSSASMPQYRQPVPVDYASQSTGTYRVAPTTGIDRTAPFAFAGLLAAGLFVVRKRKWLFS